MKSQKQAIKGIFEGKGIIPQSKSEIQPEAPEKPVEPTSCLRCNGLGYTFIKFGKVQTCTKCLSEGRLNQ